MDPNHATAVELESLGFHQTLDEVKAAATSLLQQFKALGTLLQARTHEVAAPSVAAGLAPGGVPLVPAGPLANGTVPVPVEGVDNLDPNGSALVLAERGKNGDDDVGLMEGAEEEPFTTVEVSRASERREQLEALSTACHTLCRRRHQCSLQLYWRLEATPDPFGALRPPGSAGQFGHACSSSIGR